MSVKAALHKDLPAPEDKVFPPGHMVFHEKDKQKLVVFEGRPYAGSGKAIPNDLAWLRRNNYCLSLEAQQALIPPQEQPRVKLCHKCSAENALAANYCSTCGEAQVEAKLWVPGAGGDGEVIANFIDPGDPLQSVFALQKGPLSPQPRPRQTEQELGPTMKDATDFGGVTMASIADAAGSMSPEGSDVNIGRMPFQVKPIGTVMHSLPGR